MKGGAELEPAGFSHVGSVLPCRIEVVTGLHQRGAKGTHGRVLVGAIAVGDDDGDG